MGIADGKRALIIGVANDKSLAWSIAQELRAQGAEIALTYQGEVLEKRVRPLAEQIGARVVGELDVTSDPQIDSTLSTLRQWWGGLDMLVHAVAFAEREDLRDRFLNVNRTNFARAHARLRRHPRFPYDGARGRRALATQARDETRRGRQDGSRDVE